MKNLIRAIKVICLINIICCFPLVVRNRKVLKVDSTNRSVIESNLDDYIENTKFIKKVSYGRVWSHGSLYVYYWYGKVEDVLIYEGFRTDEAWEKEWENSYQEKDRGLIVGGTSLAVLIILRKLKKIISTIK